MFFKLFFFSILLKHDTEKIYTTFDIIMYNYKNIHTRTKIIVHQLIHITLSCIIY